MKTLISPLLDELQAGRAAVLCTVLAREGSAPRGAGACLLMQEDGRFAGTVGGGAVEHAVCVRAGECLQAGRSALLRYDLSPAEAAGLGMVCGGSVRVHCWRWDARLLPLAEALQAGMGVGGDLWLARRVAPDGEALQAAVVSREGILAQWRADQTDGAPPGALAARTLAPRLRRLPLWEDGLFTEPVRLDSHAYVFGGGHIAAELVPLLARLDFAPVVMDDRPEFASADRFPDAERVVLGDFERLAASVTLTRDDYAVIMTRGHSFDHALLAQTLRTDARYIGLIGSRSKIAHTRALLLDEGFADADFARVHTPVGLPIHAQTPAEIAVSIAAEMIACRWAGDHEGDA